jgi:hypothetical protein
MDCFRRCRASGGSRRVGVSPTCQWECQWEVTGWPPASQAFPPHWPRRARMPALLDAGKMPAPLEAGASRMSFSRTPKCVSRREGILPSSQCECQWGAKGWPPATQTFPPHWPRRARCPPPLKQAHPVCPPAAPQNVYQGGWTLPMAGMKWAFGPQDPTSVSTLPRPSC